MDQYVKGATNQKSLEITDVGNRILNFPKETQIQILSQMQLVKALGGKERPHPFKYPMVEEPCAMLCSQQYNGEIRPFISKPPIGERLYYI